MREEEKKQPSQKFSIRRFLKKRWVLPAIYISSAAILLTAVIWFQAGGKDVTDGYTDNEATDVSGKGQMNEPALEVNRAIENIAMPVTDPENAVIKQHFYDSKAKKEDQEAALVFYNNQYHPNTGVNIGLESGETFDVVASLSGNVTKVEEDSLLGNIIEIQHDEGIVTQYQALTDMQVKVGDTVEQGQVLAKAGQSLFNQEAGVHVHFEIRKDNVALNPLDYFDKPLSALMEDEADEKATSEDGKTEEDEKSEDASQTDKDEETEDASPTDDEDADDDSADEEETDEENKSESKVS